MPENQAWVRQMASCSGTSARSPSSSRARAVHGTATLLFPLLAAEKSRVPFYVAGGLLASWAVIVSVVLGLRHVNFPGSLGGQRTVLAITAVLVVATIAAAVATSSSPAKKAAPAAKKSAPLRKPCRR